MNEKKDVARLIELIASEFDDLDPNIIGSDSVYKEVIEWNSINSVVLSVVIEAEYGVLLEKEDYQQTDTISQLLEWIENKLR